MNDWLNEVFVYWIKLHKSVLKWKITVKTDQIRVKNGKKEKYMESKIYSLKNKYIVILHFRVKVSFYSFFQSNVKKKSNA